MTVRGAFPFGRPNTDRPMRAAGARRTAAATIVGVYPSAWHVTWRAPTYLHTSDRTGGVRALAVDVEPTVFWNGDSTTFSQELDTWKDQVGFHEGDESGQHGHVMPTPPPANGSSGTKVEDLYLAPLGIDPDHAAFTDVYPTFVVKYAAGNRREQGDAIRQEYDRIAEQLGFRPASLPARPSPRQLPRMAIETFAERIVADLEAADAPLVITLGDEVLQTLRRLPALQATLPRTTDGTPLENLTDLYANGYGNRGTLIVNGTAVDWLPLAHPGLLKGKADPSTVIERGQRSGPGWRAIHESWARTT